MAVAGEVESWEEEVQEAGLEVEESVGNLGEEV